MALTFPGSKGIETDHTSHLQNKEGTKKTTEIKTTTTTTKKILHGGMS